MGAVEAANAGLPLTTGNCKAAVDLLQESFGNKQVIISSHMNALLKISPMKFSSPIEAKQFRFHL